jgi:hypothetical protein
VERLSAGHGRATVPGLALGSYHVRIAVFSGGRVLAQSRRALLSVFGTVPISVLFSGTGIGDNPTTNTSGAITGYPLKFVNGTPNWTAFDVTSNPCRSVSLRFLAARLFSDDPQENVTVSAAGQSSDATTGTYGTLNAAVTPGESWSLQFAQPAVDLDWGVAGSASCDSPSLSAQAPSGF